MKYVYDFDDNWEHSVVLKGIAEYPDSLKFKRALLTGARAFPPKDCLAITAALKHPSEKQKMKAY